MFESAPLANMDAIGARLMPVRCLALPCSACFFMRCKLQPSSHRILGPSLQQWQVATTMGSDVDARQFAIQRADSWQRARGASVVAVLSMGMKCGALSNSLCSQQRNKGSSIERLSPFAFESHFGGAKRALESDDALPWSSSTTLSCGSDQGSALDTLKRGFIQPNGDKKWRGP